MMKKKRLLAVMSLSAIMAISAGAFSSCDSDLIGGDILGNIGNVVGGVVGGVTDFIGGIIGSDDTATTVTLSETALELVTGESSRLVATVSSGEKATWTTSDESVVTVSDGRIKAVGAGTATITASVGDVKATCTVTVVKVEITLDKATATVERGQTLTLNAKCSKEGTLKWTSSDDSVLTVKDGVVTAKEEGTATVTVVYGSSNCKAQCEVTVVWTSKPSDYEALLNGSETDVCLTNPGKFVEWHDQNWCGSSVTVTQAEYMNGGVHISYSGVTESCWFGMQLFYKNASNVAGNNYEVSFDIESAVEGDITVNGTVVHLKKGNNFVKVYYMEGSGASLSMQMGVNGGDVIAENQIVLKNLAFADYTPEKLAAPTEFFIGASRVVTVKDVNGDKVSSYQLIFTKNGTVVNKVSLQSGESFDDSTMEDGEYQVSVVAVGEGKYQNSDPCATVLTYTVANGGVKYAMENGVASVAVANPGKYYYWTEFGGIESSDYENGKITFEVSNGGNWYSNQIFYKNPGLTTGKTYTVTLKIQSSVAEQITLNGTVLDLIVGTKEYTVNYTEPATDPSFSMQMGVNGGVSLGEGSFVLSDIVWTESTGTVTPPDGGETTTGAILAGGETDAVANPDKCYYWTEFAGIANGKYENGKISFDVINGGNWYSNQVFLKKSDLTNGKTYKLTLKLSSTVAGKITLNGTVIDLKVGENNVEITYTEETKKASVSFQAGVNGGVSLDEGGFILSDLVWTEVENGGDSGDSGEVTPPANENAIANGDEKAAVGKPGTYIEWHDQNWCGTNVTVSKAELKDGVIELTYSGATETAWYGMQLFYKNASNVAGKTYEISLSIDSLEAGKITVSGTVVELVKGSNTVKVQYTEVADKASLSIQMGVENPASVIAANTVVIKNVTFTEVTSGTEGGETTPTVKVTSATMSDKPTIELRQAEGKVYVVIGGGMVSYEASNIDEAEAKTKIEKAIADLFYSDFQRHGDDWGYPLGKSAHTVNLLADNKFEIVMDVTDASELMNVKLMLHFVHKNADGSVGSGGDLDFKPDIDTFEKAITVASKKYTITYDKSNCYGLAYLVVSEVGSPVMNVKTIALEEKSGKAVLVLTGNHENCTEETLTSWVIDGEVSGRTVLTRTITLNADGTFEVVVDINELPASGFYYLHAGFAETPDDLGAGSAKIVEGKGELTVGNRKYVLGEQWEVRGVTISAVADAGNSGNNGNENEGGDTSTDETNVQLEFVETYGDGYMHFNATSEYDIATAAHVKVNGTQQWQELTKTGTGWAFKVYVGDLTQETYTFAWYDGTGAVVARAIYTHGNQS